MFIKKTSLYTAVCLAILMPGVAGTHFLNDSPQQAIPAIVLLVLCSIAAYLH